MTKSRNKTTVIFVNQAQNSNRPIQIPTSYLAHWKKIILGIAGLFVILVFSVFYLIRSNSDVLLAKSKLEKALLENKKKLAVIDTSSIQKH